MADVFETSTTEANHLFANPLQQLGAWRYSLLVVGVLAQIVTILITWPLWQFRDSGMPNLPLFSVPDFSFGLLVIASTALVIGFPRPAIWLNLAVLVVATMFDQMRTQPQVLAIWLLMWATISPTGFRITRWYLVAMWCWAGLHKFLSPDWMTYSSSILLAEAGFDPKSIQLEFAILVASSELSLGILAWFKPRWASWLCPFLHIGIVVLLSPLFRNANFSVIPGIWPRRLLRVGFYWCRPANERQRLGNTGSRQY